MADPNTRPRVGDFRSKPDNQPRTDQAPPTTAPAEETTTTETPVPEETPKQRYLKRLEEAKIPFNVAASIFDAVLEKDYYEEFVKVGKHQAKLRTRLYDDSVRLQTALEVTRPTLVLTQEDMITRYNLAASLYAWKGEEYKHATDDDFDAVLVIVKKMSAPIYSLLAQKLAEFDRKIMTIFSEGATDTF